MKKKILIIGKKSFVGKNLFFFLKKKFKVRIIDYESFFDLNFFFLSRYDVIINCSLNSQYVNHKYQVKNDFDYKIAKLIKNTNCRMIFLSSRKVYKNDDNIKETSKLLPGCNYSRNKSITEKKLLSLLGKKILVLRLSNLIGHNFKFNNTRKIHHNFIDHFLANINKNLIYDNKKVYKDFLPMNKFSEIIFKLIKKNSYGLYNVSLGQKVFLKDLINWLNFYNSKSAKYIDLPTKAYRDCFYLNNSKLLREINIKITLEDLKKYCKTFSKKLFVKK